MMRLLFFAVSGLSFEKFLPGGLYPDPAAPRGSRVDQLLG